MASKGGVGIELVMDDVPQRETGMTPYEMMLSESQERMLMVLKPGREDEAAAIFRKWELDFAVIGRVTDTGRMVLTHKGETVCDIPLGPLADDAPALRPAACEDAAPASGRQTCPTCTDPAADLLTLMASPDIASRRWIWEQYDHMVGADTVQRPGGDAGVVRVHGTDKGLAVSTDCTPRYCYADPYEGGKQAIAECWRNLTAVGATPLATTDCMNFGNPQRPEIMGQFVGCIEGMAEACTALDFPIVSGNVSLYNETKDEAGGAAAILPTPAIGGIGLLADWSKSGDDRVQGHRRHHRAGRRPQGPSRPVVMAARGPRDRRPRRRPAAAGRPGRRTRGGRLTSVERSKAASSPPATTYPMAASRSRSRRWRWRAGSVRCWTRRPNAGSQGTFFAEDQGLYLVTVEDHALYDFLLGAEADGVDAHPIGRTIAGRIVFELEAGDYVVPLEDLRRAHEGFFPALMGDGGGRWL